MSTDTVNKPKLQLRPGLAANATDKTPSPATKLLISHGKPNFTIQRSPKAQNGDSSPLSPLAQNNNNNDNAFKNANGNGNGNIGNGTNINNGNGSVNSESNGGGVVKSTKFNGVFRPANVPLAAKQPHQQSAAENEAARVVLRRARAPEPAAREPEDDAVPEFIRRQRRIQERLAKENVLDFENRRSGYFTHVLISPTSASRTSFVETMASPAPVPSLEIPPKKEEQQPAATNGHAQQEDEEEAVAQAIEEVNRAVAGEDDGERPEELVHAAVAVSTLEQAENEVVVSHTNGAAHASGALLAPSAGEQLPGPEQVEAPAAAPAELTNGSSQMEEGCSHASGALCVNVAPAADEARPISTHPSGALCANVEGAEGAVADSLAVAKDFQQPLLQEPVDPASVETSTHASGALCLGQEPQPAEGAADSVLQELAKLKFEIKGDGAEDVEVTPVLRTETE